MSIRGILMVLGLFVLGVSFSGFAAYSSGVMNPHEVKEIDGKKLAGQYCSSCHGKDLAGDKGPDLHDRGSKMTAESIAQIIKDGVGDMPAFAGGKLKDEKEINAVAQYITTLGAK